MYNCVIFRSFLIVSNRVPSSQSCMCVYENYGHLRHGLYIYDDNDHHKLNWIDFNWFANINLTNMKNITLTYFLFNWIFPSFPRTHNRNQFSFPCNICLVASFVCHEILLWIHGMGFKYLYDILCSLIECKAVDSN